LDERMRAGVRRKALHGGEPGRASGTAAEELRTKDGKTKGRRQGGRFLHGTKTERHPLGDWVKNTANQRRGLDLGEKSIPAKTRTKSSSQ